MMLTQGWVKVQRSTILGKLHTVKFRDLTRKDPNK